MPLKYEWIVCQFCPSFKPMKPKNKDQKNEPMNERARNGAIFTLATPAGKEMNVLTTGKNLPMKFAS